jgi:hypothetical protein
MNSSTDEFKSGKERKRGTHQVVVVLLICNWTELGCEVPLQAAVRLLVA